ncbi:hypothetical protein [Streptomyces sp. NPDC057877]|uniref:hypothetical protein n=1 Tax=Streptomyces sp. NPDC057877 TaxID=3346269 RepID=UPI00368256F0
MERDAGADVDADAGAGADAGADVDADVDADADLFSDRNALLVGTGRRAPSGRERGALGDGLAGRLPFVLA